MPAYVYECEQCKYSFETFHSITEQLHDCVNCNSADTLKKVPQLLTSYSKQKTGREVAGERVEKFIEDSRKILLDSKSELMNREYKK